MRGGGAGQRKAGRGGAGRGGAGWSSASISLWCILSIPSIHRREFCPCPPLPRRGEGRGCPTLLFDGRGTGRTGGTGCNESFSPVDRRVSTASILSLTCSKSLRRASEASVPTMIPALRPPPQPTRTHTRRAGGTFTSARAVRGVCESFSAFRDYNGTSFHAGLQPKKRANVHWRNLTSWDIKMLTILLLQQ